MSHVHGNPRRATLRALAALPGLLLVACGPVMVKPDYTLPKPLLAPLPAHAGLLVDEELRNFTHEETRGGQGWKVELGPGHRKLFQEMFSSSFGELQVFDDLDSARAAGGLQAIFAPHIEQYSFATASETSGGYWAVTISYRIGVLAPSGEPLDALTLTGYGSQRGGNAGTALTRATHAAMRDAAAKFLVQMPRQSLAQKLKAGQVLQASDAAVAAADVVEAVPIDPPQPAG